VYLDNRLKTGPELEIINDLPTGFPISNIISVDPVIDRDQC